MTVPVELMELADELSSSYVSLGSSTRGSGGGSEESFVLANDLARSDIVDRQKARSVCMYYLGGSRSW